MTNDELQQYYANLLIIQYVGKTKAYATIKALVYMPILNQLPVSVQDAFNLIEGTTIAVGDQLDILGKYAGVTRSGQGFFAPITLDDADFISLIRIAIVQNSSGSSLATIQQNLFDFFAGGMLVFDYKDMSMTYYISSTVGSIDLVQLFVTEGLLPRPMAVFVNIIIYAPVIDKFFSFRTYDLPVTNGEPFNDYADYQEDWPWLSYADAIIPP